MAENSVAGEFRWPLRVYIEDTDAGGIVYYVNYLKFMERGRTELMRSLGYDKPALLPGGEMLVVHSAQLQYRKPARLDDALIATAVFGKRTPTSVVFQQRILRQLPGGAEELLCEGEIRVACVRASDMRPVAMPAPVRATIDAYLAASL